MKNKTLKNNKISKNNKRSKNKNKTSQEWTNKILQESKKNTINYLNYLNTTKTNKNNMMMNITVMNLTTKTTLKKPRKS